MEPKILNSKGEPVVLNSREGRLANFLQRQCNALGFEINITTLTTIMKKISEQKFFEVMPADYLPVRVGEGAWSSNLTTYRSFNMADDFATGVINTGANNGRLANADAAVDSLNIKVINWAKSIGWSIFDLELAAKSGNWDLVTAKERSRKKNWDLGIQKVAFLGLAGESACPGLLNLPGIVNDTTFLTQNISSLDPDGLNGFVEGILNVYRANANRTAWPTHFVIPESDYLGLAAPSSSQFPIKSKLEVLEETFQTMTKNKGFKILPVAYGDAAYNGLGTQRYVLLNYDEETLVMNIPVDYTNTLANSIDNFSFQNVGYGQFSGVLALRPREIYYLSHA